MKSPNARGCLIVNGMATEKRLRVSFDAENDVVRRAIYIAAAMQDKSHNEVLNDIVKAHLGEYLELARKAIQRDEPPPRRRRDAD